MKNKDFFELVKSVFSEYTVDIDSSNRNKKIRIYDNECNFSIFSYGFVNEDENDTIWHISSYVGDLIEVTILKGMEKDFLEYFKEEILPNVKQISRLVDKIQEFKLNDCKRKNFIIKNRDFKINKILNKK